MKRTNSCRRLDPNLNALLVDSIASLDRLGTATAKNARSDSPTHQQPSRTSTFKQLRGELDVYEQHSYDLSRAQLRTTIRNSAMLAGFAMVALVELQFEDDTPTVQMVLLGVVVTLNVSVHLVALMISSHILPYMEAAGCTQDSPHIKLKFFIDLSWVLCTCVGIPLFLVMVGVAYFLKFHAVDYDPPAYVTTAMLVPVLLAIFVISYIIHRKRMAHTFGRFHDKVDSFKHFFEGEPWKKSHTKVV